MTGAPSDFWGFLFTQGVLGVALAGVLLVFFFYYKNSEAEKKASALEVKELNKFIFDQVNLRVSDSQGIIKENTEAMRNSSQALSIISEKIETNKAAARAA